MEISTVLQLNKNCRLFVETYRIRIPNALQLRKDGYTGDRIFSSMKNV